MNDVTDLNDLAIILAAAFVGGALLRTLRQPVLVGYILVGALFGPTGLGLVTNIEDIRWLADLGILLLMFYIGLEIDVQRFRDVARQAFTTTGLQIAVAIISTLAIAAITHWPLKVTILFGCGLALSSSAIALKILDEMGVKHAPAGQASMGILIAQDLSIVPMMLVLEAMKTGGDFDFMGVVRLAIGIGILFIVLWLSLRQPAWFMEWGRKIVRLKSKAMHGQDTITALAICFAGAALAGAFGLSAAYGAFLAGLAISRTKNREKMHKNAQPIFDVLMMMFFLSVGLLIDIHFICAHWGTVLGLVAAVLVIKTLVNYILLRMQRMPKPDARLVAAVTGQIGEFSFLLAAMGLADGSLDGDMHNYAVAVISLTLVGTPVWLALLRQFRAIPPLTRSPGAALENAARGVA